MKIKPLCILALSVCCGLTNAALYGCDDLTAVRADGVNKDTCNEEDYARDRLLIPAAVPAGLGLLLFFFFFPIFLISRYCCGCCGGSGPSPSGYCCPTETAVSPATAYPAATIKRSKLILIPISIFLLITCSTIIYGNHKANDGYDSAFDGVVKADQTAQNMVKTFMTCMRRPPPQQDNAGNWDNSTFVKAVHDLQNSADDVEKARRDYQYIPDIVTASTLAFAGLPVLLCGVSLLFAFRKVSGCAPMIVVGILFFWTFLCLVLLGGHVMSFNLMSDLCDAIDDELSVHQVDGVIAAVLEYECRGSDLEGYINDVLTASTTQNSVAVSQCSSFLKSLCGSDDWVCLENAIDCTDVKKILSQLSDSNVIHVSDLKSCGPDISSGMCSLKDCADSCTDASMASVSKTFLLDSQDAVQASGCLDEWGYSSCQVFVRDVAVKPQQTTCDDSREALLCLVIGLSLLVVGLGALMLALSKGSKTFIEPHVSDYASNALLDNEEWMDPDTSIQMHACNEHEPKSSTEAVYNNSNVELAC